jgi:cell division protein FtsB
MSKNKNTKFTSFQKPSAMNFKSTTASVAFLFILFTVAAQTKEYKRYSMKSAIVNYEMSGLQNGTAKLYFDDYGMKEATYETATLEMYGIKKETETVNYLNGYWQYNLDKKANSATKSKNTMLESIVEGSEDGDLVEVGLEMFEAMGGKKTGHEEIIGKPCEIWELQSMGTKVWVWKNIPLRSETDIMGIKIIRVATDVDENADIPSGKIEIPTDIVFMEIE